MGRRCPFFGVAVSIDSRARTVSGPQCGAAVALTCASFEGANGPDGASGGCDPRVVPR
jgi:hypothetical protein